MSNKNPVAHSRNHRGQLQPLSQTQVEMYNVRLGIYERLVLNSYLKYLSGCVFNVEISTKNHKRAGANSTRQASGFSKNTVDINYVLSYYTHYIYTY